MRITADTNVLVRAIIRDDALQAEAARQILAGATLVVIPIAVFCEFGWVLGTGYRYSREQIRVAIIRLLSADTVVTDRPAVEAGLTFLAAGGDFADGAIAHQGRQRGGTHFASFDTAARRFLASQGHKTISPLDV